ncbi:MAG: Rid family detoxifying hydrolase [bacterium]|nr:Rid family detoxifying hydrolase [bacterium]
MIKRIDSKKAPSAAGPYSQALKAGNFVFCSGQIGLDPKTNLLINGGIEKETEQTLKNLHEILKSAKLNFKDVVKVEIFITDMKNFPKVNDIYATFFASNPKPARQTIGIASLPKGASIEISCIAYCER